MVLKSITLSGFRCFKETKTIELDKMNGLVGSNGSGKTTLLQALARLFSPHNTERLITNSDFYIQRGTQIEDIPERELFIEVVFAFPELQGEGEQAEAAVAECFTHMSVSSQDGSLICRVRLEAKWEKDNTPEGSIEQEVFWITTASESFTDDDKKRLSPHDRSRIHVHYIPASRDPQKQIKQAGGSILHRLFKAIKWSEEIKGSLETIVDELNITFKKENGVTDIHNSLSSEWKRLFKADVYTDVTLSPMANGLENFLSKIEASFSPADSGGKDGIERLSDGMKSLFYFTLMGTLFDIEDKVLSEEIQDIDIDLLDPPNLIIFAIEEPENHLAPHFQGRLIASLRKFIDSERAQVLLTSHSPSIIKRVNPEEILYLRLNSSDSTAEVAKVVLPEDGDEAHKFVRGALLAYPELYFSRLVILGEGDSEEIVIPKIAEAMDVDLDSSFVSFVPLGGRHVNHFWRLLENLGIPYITLLDMDLGRSGGGWGRIKYAIHELIDKGNDCSMLLQGNTGPVELEQLGNFSSKTESDIKALYSWVNALKQYNIFFSYPLDLDFSMELKFSEYYRLLPKGARGPTIPNVEESEKRLNALQRTLKKEGDTECYIYQHYDSEHFYWYNYLFLGRGKPVSHINALANIEQENLAGEAPLELKVSVIGFICTINYRVICTT